MTLHIDPTTGSRPETFPPLEFETVAIAGVENILGQPILLPRINLTNAKIVGGNEDVILTMEGVPGVQLKVFTNSVTFPDGSTTGLLSISQVHLDKVPMVPPKGSIPLIVSTIQPAGVHFNPPAQVILPNSQGHPPGTIAQIFQFDHDIFNFVDVGRGTVSEDGFTVTSDPGFGITRSGWNGVNCNSTPITTQVAIFECEDEALEAKNIADVFEASLPTAAPWTKTQACIAETNCSRAREMGFENNEWVTKATASFVKKFRDGAIQFSQGKDPNDPRTSGWVEVLQNCQALINPTPGFSEVGETLCSLMMVNQHIFTDLLESLLQVGRELIVQEEKKNGAVTLTEDEREDLSCGTKADWKSVREIIEDCSSTVDPAGPDWVGFLLVRDGRNNIRSLCKLYQG